MLITSRAIAALADTVIAAFLYGVQMNLSTPQARKDVYVVHRLLWTNTHTEAQETIARGSGRLKNDFSRGWPNMS